MLNKQVTGTIHEMMKESTAKPRYSATVYSPQFVAVYRRLL